MSYKWSKKLFDISDSKLIIGILSQPILYVTSQFILYDGLTLQYTIMFPTQSTNYILLIYSTCSSSRLSPFHTSIKKLSSPLHQSLTRDHCHNSTRTIFRISRMSVPELRSNTPFPKEDSQVSLRRTHIFIWSHRYSPSHRRGFKLCSILESPNIKISIFKWNLRHCLDLISLFTRLPPTDFWIIWSGSWTIRWYLFCLGNHLGLLWNF